MLNTENNLIWISNSSQWYDPETMLQFAISESYVPHNHNNIETILPISFSK